MYELIIATAHVNPRRALTLTSYEHENVLLMFPMDYMLPDAWVKRSDLAPILFPGDSKLG